MQAHFLPAIYKFAPTLMIGLFLSKAIGQEYYLLSRDWFKRILLHWSAYAIFDPIYIKAWPQEPLGKVFLYVDIW